MKPPDDYNVLDRHGGFTAVTMIGLQHGHGIRYSHGPNISRFRASSSDDQREIMRGRYQTLWRTSWFLHLADGQTPAGKLIGYDEQSFFQNNNDVTIAFYQVKGYQYIVACWFDNQTGERIA